jgi:hypothetical protein
VLLSHRLIRGGRSVAFSVELVVGGVIGGLAILFIMLMIVVILAICRGLAGF